MANDEQQIKSQDEPQHPASPGTDPHKVATSLGAVGGGVAGAAIGRSIGGKAGAAVGGVAGAIVGGIAGNTLADRAEEIILIGGFGSGADHKPIELPHHYTWEELQALSKPQGGKIHAVVEGVKGAAQEAIKSN